MRRQAVSHQLAHHQLEQTTDGLGGVQSLLVPLQATIGAIRRFLLLRLQCQVLVQARRHITWHTAKAEPAAYPQHCRSERGVAGEIKLSALAK